MSGIYLHIPFCKQACHYCDFYFSTVFKDKDALIDAICSELVLQKNFLTDEVESIYFGGGTPSILSDSQLSKILNTIHSNYKIGTHLELTLEANPDDLTKEKTAMLKTSGVNRLSVGIQSFEDDLLKLMNRAHDSKQAIEALENCYAAGINNLNLDLIYGIPTQTLDSLQSDLEIIQHYKPAHISAYSLTIEPKTVFGNWSKKGNLKVVDDDVYIEHFHAVQKALRSNHFEQYEISNYCRDEKYSQHNSSYWLGKHYLGIGPSAHSYDGKSRFSNVANNTKYIKDLQEGKVPNTEEILSINDKLNDYILTRLRTKWGLEKDQLPPAIISQLHVFMDDNLITFDGTIYTLTESGKLLADSITEELFQ